MVGFITVTQSTQNFNRVLYVGCLNEHRRESAFKRRVFLNVLAVFVQGGCPNCLELSTGKHWLKNACCINRTFSCTRTHECVNFVDEKDDVSASTDLFQDFLQSLFKVTAVTTACDQRAKVKAVHLLVFESFWDFPCHDVLGETFNDCSLANAGLTNKYRVIFRAAR